MPSIQPNRFLFNAFLTLLSIISGHTAAAQTEYADKPLSYHITRHALLQSSYIPVSLDVAGERDASRWSAVWDHNTAGVEWDSIYGADATEFLQWSFAMQFTDFSISWITASGSGANTVYGAIARKDGKTRSMRRDLDPSQLQASLSDLNRMGYRPICMSVYGDAVNPRYALVFEENPDNVRWGYVENASASEYQKQYDAFVSKCWCRLSFVTRSPWGTFYAFFEDDEVGDWVASHDMSPAQYSDFVNYAASHGMRRARIDMTGTGANARFSVLCNTRNPAPIQFTATGSHIPELLAVDQVITDGDGGYMRDYNIRQAAVAIVRKGRLVFARAYTLGTSAYPIATPQTRFRMASLSKLLNSFALHKMLEHRTDLHLNTKVGTLLAFGFPVFPSADPRAADITLRHLLNHTSGYVASWASATDRVPFGAQSLSQALLASNPGAEMVYSNSGYQLLSAALEAATLVEYRHYMESQILAPAGVMGAQWWARQPIAGNARFQESDWRRSPNRTPENNHTSRRLKVVRSRYAPFDYINKTHNHGDMELDASGGMVMSAIDYARVVAAALDDSIQTGLLSPASKASIRQEAMAARGGGFDGRGNWKVNGQTVFENGAPVQIYDKGGLWHSSRPTVLHLSNGVTLVACTTGPEPLSAKRMLELVSSVPETAWPSTDLFPSFGYPSFPRAAGVTGTSFGPGCGSAPTLELQQASPQNDQVTISALGAGWGSLGITILGFSNTTWSGQALPIPLAAFGAPGCLQLVAADATGMATGNLSGNIDLTFALPQNHGMLAYNLYAQFAIADPTANALGFVFTNGVDIQVTM